MREACRLAGTARAEDGTAAAVRSCGIFAPRFQHRFGHFLHEQRDAVSALNNVLPDVRRKRLVADNAVDHGVDFALCQPVEGECGNVRPSNPRRLELWTERHDQQHAQEFLSGPRPDRTLPGSLGRPNVHPQKS